ncbi:MAG: potassium transporter KefB [Chitinophagaceae bacterium]|nr:potassium transporter KefB [Chitinophagaceae bacterium]
MTQKHSMTTPDRRSSLGKRMLLGAGIALALITLFLLGAGEPNPEWDIILRYKAYFITPLAGALGAGFSWFIDPMRSRGGWRKVFAIFASVIVFVFALWIGTVLGFKGTYWH